MDIFVGNLSFDAREADVKKLFLEFGKVAAVAIVKRKEKNGPKSRGFGFVDMPDEQQANIAITALAGKEFMGRVLDISPSRRTQPISRFKPDADKRSGEIERRPGKYKGGRRSVNYMKRQGFTAKEQTERPRKSFQDNPLRWRKKKNQPKPWDSKPAGAKPWDGKPAEARPWYKQRRKAVLKKHGHSN